MYMILGNIYFRKIPILFKKNVGTTFFISKLYSSGTIGSLGQRFDTENIFPPLIIPKDFFEKK